MRGGAVSPARMAAGGGAASGPRWRRRKEARPGEIIAAALAEFVERGFAATRLDDIAARAGVTRGTLYLYFPNKEELFKAVVRQSLLPVLARAEAMTAGAGEALPTAELLRRLIEFFPDAILASPAAALPKLILSEAGNFPDLARFYLDEVIGRGRVLVRAILRRGIARGEFRPVDEAHAFYCVIAPVLLAALWRHSLERYAPGALDARALCRVHAELLLNGLRARPPGPGPEGTP